MHSNALIPFSVILLSTNNFLKWTCICIGIDVRLAERHRSGLSAIKPSTTATDRINYNEDL